MNKELIYAYTAGIIDGEGYIGLLKTSGEGRSDIYFCPTVKVKTIDDFIVPFLKKEYGGYFYIEKRKDNRIPPKTWELKNQKPVKEFLLKIYPYLRLKKQQADVIFEYVDKTRYSKSHSFNGKIKEEERQLRFKLYNKLKSFHTRQIHLQRLSENAPTDNAEGEATV